MQKLHCIECIVSRILNALLKGGWILNVLLEAKKFLEDSRDLFIIITLGLEFFIIETYVLFQMNWFE